MGGRRRRGRGLDLSHIYNPTLNHVEQMLFRVRHYTFAEPYRRLRCRAESCFLPGNTRERSALPVSPPPLRLPTASPPGRQKVTCLPPSCFISTHHVRTRLPRYMQPHLLYQMWVNYSARLRPPPLPSLDFLRERTWRELLRTATRQQ